MTGPGALVIEPLVKRHDRAAFSCGIPALDHYLARRAGQDVRRRIARVFVCTAGGADAVLGFYTLSAPVDRLDISTRAAVPKATSPPGALRPDRPVGH